MQKICSIIRHEFNKTRDHCQYISQSQLPNHRYNRDFIGYSYIRSVFYPTLEKYETLDTFFYIYSILSMEQSVQISRIELNIKWLLSTTVALQKMKGKLDLVFFFLRLSFTSANKVCFLIIIANNKSYYQGQYKYILFVIVKDNNVKTWSLLLRAHATKRFLGNKVGTSLISTISFIKHMKNNW